jgi:hypothetical protein
MVGRGRAAEHGGMRIPTWLIPLSRWVPERGAPHRAADPDPDLDPSHWVLSSLDLAEGLDVAEVGGPLPAFPDTMPAFQIPRA